MSQLEMMDGRVADQEANDVPKVNGLGFSSSAWYLAATLAERHATLRATGTAADAGVGADRADRRWQRWQSQAPFDTEALFAQRLASAGTAEDEMRQLLGDSPDSLRRRFAVAPAWLVELQQAYSRSDDSPNYELPEDWHAEELVEFLDLIAPLVARGRQRVREAARALSAASSSTPFDAATVEDLLFSSLPWQLRRMLSRTLVLELHVARLQGLLEGATPEERFRSFVERLRERDFAEAILQEYPVLARQLVNAIGRWVQVSQEFLHRLYADWEAIRSTFSPGHDPGMLIALDGNMGDSHRGGRAVLVARFESGFRLVYKPKSLAVDRHFQELLAWLNGRGDHPPFRTLTILDRGDYGWVEFVPTQGCGSPLELERFFERQGAYLALLYALEATDFHSENLIACGEHPVLLDLEALFHPRVGGAEINAADGVAGATINYSVLRVGLLPERVWGNGEGAGVDISGLGAPAGQLSPYDIAFWEAVGTDEVRLARKRMEMLPDRNRPTLDGADVNVLDYAELIVSGFSKMYQLLLRHRAELTDDDGPLTKFSEDEVRVIMRGTKTYGVLLDESFHPDVLRDALDRDRLFDRLWISVPFSPCLARVIHSEHADLWNGDIPMFTTRPGSRDLWSSTHQRMADFFDEPSMTLVQRRLRQLSAADLAQQLWIIRASLATVATGGDQAPLPGYRLIDPQAPADRERLIGAARAIGDRLEERAVRGTHDVCWIGMTLTDNRYWSLAPVGTDLYDGVPGIAHFLGYLGRVTGESRYTALAESAVASMRHQLERNKPFLTSIGGFDGWGGVVYALSHWGALWNRRELLDEAASIVDLLPNLIERDEHLDIISGAAGCVGGLRSLFHTAPSEAIRAAARQCGDRLVARAQSAAQGVGWTAQMPARGPLTGFSHGAAGMAWALLEVAELTGEPRFRATAVAAMEYERSLFSPEIGNWPDLRLDDGEKLPVSATPPEYFMSWCHGAPGIGLARLHGLRHLDDAATRAEIDAALKTTLAKGFGRNHTLCHGDLGNLELLLEAAETLGEPRWRREVDRLAAAILESIERDGWLSAVPLAVEAPGLMTGLAGIGYGLLRLAEPTRVPSVLAMAPPIVP